MGFAVKSLNFSSWLKMYSLFKMGIFQPAMFVYRRVQQKSSSNSFCGNTYSGLFFMLFKPSRPAVDRT